MKNKGFWDSEDNQNTEETALTTPAPEAYYEEVDSEEAENIKDKEERYYEVFNKDKPKYIIWSLISAILGGISVICAFFGWGGLIVGGCAVVFAIISRINLKYFDKISIMGLILGIFGIVFGVAVIVIEILVENGALTDYYVQKK